MGSNLNENNFRYVDSKILEYYSNLDYSERYYGDVPYLNSGIEDDFFRKVKQFLSKEEQSILFLLRKGKTLNEICLILDIKYNTLWHKKDILLEALKMFYTFSIDFDLNGYKKFLELKYQTLLRYSLMRLPISIKVYKLKSVFTRQAIKENNLYSSYHSYFKDNVVSKNMGKLKRILKADNGDWYNLLISAERMTPKRKGSKR